MDKPALAWLVIGLLCCGVEMLVPAFGFCLVGAAALVASAVAGSGYNFWIQLGAFAAGSALATTVLRTRIVDKLARQAPGVPSRTEKLQGKPARVTEAIDPVTGSGRVLVEGHDWAALAAEPIPAGAEVKVEGADGIRLRVRRA
jgi:membrane protein implicated in regulation of membrane protease activity